MHIIDECPNNKMTIMEIHKWGSCNMFQKVVISKTPTACHRRPPQYLRWRIAMAPGLCRRVTV